MVEESEFEVEEWLANWLAEDTAVAAVVQGRVHPNFLPDDRSLPGITYTRLGTTRAKHLRGAAGNATVRIRLEMLGEASRQGYREAAKVSRAVRLALEGFQGSDRKHHVRSVWIEDEKDDPQPGVFGDGTMGVVNRRVLEISVDHTETVRGLIRA